MTRPHLLPCHLFQREWHTFLAMGDCIACGAATSKPLCAASSPHHGQHPSVSVLSESTVGASNWGVLPKQIQSIFFIHSRPSPSYSAAQSCKPSSSTAIIICHRCRPPLPSLSAAAVFHPRSHHRHSAVFSVSCHCCPFPTVVHHLILRAFIVHR